MEVWLRQQGLGGRGQVRFIFQNSDTYAAVNRILRELDTVQLPPFVNEGATTTDLTLELWAVRTGAAVNLVLDCLLLLPLDGYRRLESLNGVANDSVLMDDSIAMTVYQDVANQQMRDISTAGKPLMLWPGVDQRIYFLRHSITDVTQAIDDTGTVSIYYRPRRVTL